MWPFRGKKQANTIEDTSKILSDELKTGMEIYLEAMDQFVVINNNLFELKDFVEEIWTFQIALLNYTCTATNYPEIERDKIITQIIGYTNIDYKHYIERSQNYEKALTHVNPELVPLTISNVLAEIIDTEYSGYKTPKGKELLIESFSAFSFKTMKKLGSILHEGQHQSKIADKAIP